MTPATIDRLLRKGGHPRHDGRTRMTRYSIGYGVDDNLGTLNFNGLELASETYALVWHDPGPGQPDAADDALAAYAGTLTASGYNAERVEIVVNVDGEEFRSARLLVTRGDDR